MNNVTLYTTHCSMCNVLERKLKDNNISYDVIEGDKPILDLGFTSAPLLKIGQEVKYFSNANKAVEWVLSTCK